MFKKKEPEISEEKKQQILRRIRPLIASELKVSQEQITEGTRLFEDLGVDSLQSIEVTMVLEEAFNIEILDREAEKMKTVGDIIAYLAKRIEF